MKIAVLFSLFFTSLCLASEYVPREYYGAKHEPVDTVLHGGGQDTGTSLSNMGENLPDGFIEYAEALEPDQYPVLWMTYISLSKKPRTIVRWGKHVKKKLEETGRDNVLPQVGLNLTSSHDQGDGLDEKIAAGKYDKQIEAFCRALQLIDRPVFVRIGYEFEGSWNGYTPEGFIATWKRVTEAMRRHEIDAVTVWCSAGGSAGPMPLEDVMKFYPGDEWVDWWGVDVFSPEEIGTEKLKEFCVEAGRRRKPVMLGEVTPRYVGVMKGEESWNEWFAPFFAFIRERPEVKSFCYINWDWDCWAETLGFEWINWQDSRIQNNEFVLEAYRKEMSSPLYQHAK